MSYDSTLRHGDIPTGDNDGLDSRQQPEFQEVDEAELRRQIRNGIGEDHDWGEIAPPRPTPPPQERYPKWPGSLDELLGAVSRRTGASRSTTATVLLPAMSALISFHYDVATLASKPSPTSIYACAITESTWRKSTAAVVVWEPHWLADATVSDRHKQLVRATKEQAKSASKGKQVDSAEDEAPREWVPILMRSDDTIEVIRQRLARGRPVLFQALDEAALSVGGYSFTGQRLIRTMGIYSTLWTGVPNGEGRIGSGVNGGGREIYLKGGAYALNVCWIGQKNVLTPLITSDAAAMGMSGRMLVAWDSVRPDSTDALPGDAQVVDLYQSKVLQWRQVQDDKTIFRDWDLPDRQTIGMTAEATARLRDYNDEMMHAADLYLDDGRLLEQGAAGRAAEMATRIAAVFAAWEAWPMVPDGAGNITLREPSGAVDQPQVGLDLIEAAITIVEWHRRELKRVVDSAGATDKVRTLEGAIRVIAEATGNPDKFNGNGQVLVDSHGHVTLQTLLAQYGPAAIRGDVDYKAEIIEVLLTERYVREVEGGRGRFAIHPNISNAVRRRKTTFRN